MRGDIGCLDELHERVTLLVAGSKHHNPRGTECDHINGLHQFLGKFRNGWFGADGGMVARTGIDDKMIAPYNLWFTKCAKCAKFTKASFPVQRSTHPMTTSHKK